MAAESLPFPGRWIGGASLVLGPLLLLAGVLLRAPYDFFFPAQLAAHHQHPVLLTAAYSAFAAGTVVLWPGVCVLALRIASHRPAPALWGGTLTLLGLFARTFHAGVDHLALRLGHILGTEEAVRVVGESYGAFHVFSALNAVIMGGWVVLAVGAHRARVLGPLRSLALGLTSLLPLGVLKGTTPLSVVAVAGLCLALVPLGVAMWRRDPLPAGAVGRILGVAAVAFAMVLFGRFG